MATLSWDGSAPPSGRTETTRELATAVPGLRLRATAIGAPELAVTVTGTDRLLLIEADPVGATDELPARVRIDWRLPCTGATALWRPNTDSRWLPPSWSTPREASLAAGAPIGSLVGAGDAALCSYAVAEPVGPVRIGEGVVEETGEFTAWVEQQGRLRLRLDLTGRHFSDTVRELVRWWEALSTVRVPDEAFDPVFCTWYARHLEITAPEVERLAALAAPLGFGAVIVDDGWQTPETTRSYATAGDWEPAFPDFGEHVQRVQDLGLAYLLWCALPFAGDRSALGRRFAGRHLAHREELDTSVLDPAVPEVRAHLVARIGELVGKYGLDGLKLDFIDTFARCGGDVEGVRLLLAELAEVLPAGLLVEHRQPYVGPGLWPYATMVRATDCPHNAAENRQRTTDLRLTAGPLAVHADPLTWHPDESPTEIAVLLQQVLFATPQVSVDLGAQGPEQLAALRFWLGVAREHVELLQRGRFRAYRPELGYPLLESADGAARAFGRYAPVPIEADAEWSLLLVANADPDPGVRLSFPEPPGRVTVLVHGARGEVLSEYVTDCGGELTVTAPRGSLLTLRR
ncbi:glycoside hydrolase family 36 protein [Kitasatospora viridis]|uniref:Alpha-galactosidase n=1 Tax=Kitasatospora viridis TaxID=281105 RepID=A0A561UNN9_9ACTN|nr:glycoside hydrolase family 36 protein [Kitasatospora viridis]TWG00967.1 alpha-galactosidase [Kitasatospora viridis]